MYIRSASSPSTVLWAFHTIQPSSLTMFFGMYFLIFLISDSCTELLELRKAAPCRSDVEYKVDDLLYLHSIPSRAYALDSFVDFGTVYFVCLFTLFFFFFVFTARRYASAVLAVVVCQSVCLSVCPSVRLSVTSRYCIETATHRITQTTPYGSPGNLVF